jgi:hypothetical protein
MEAHWSNCGLSYCKVDLDSIETAFLTIIGRSKQVSKMHK